MLGKALCVSCLVTYLQPNLHDVSTFVGISSPMKTIQVGGMKNLRLREARRLHVMRLPEV